MITKVFEYIEKFHMIKDGDRVVVGLSGGADSVCLLFILKELRKTRDFFLEAIHVHHGLRPEADKEAEFAEALCETWEIPYGVEKIDVTAYQKEHHLGTEEAARILRYEIFKKKQLQNKKIALAHHKNDQAETVLFHLFRGSNLRGLRGMEPVRELVIRPLLCVSREEIETFLKDKQLEYVTDQSNFDTVYSRNLIRHELIPLVESKVCTEAVEHICQSAEGIYQALDYLDKEAKTQYEKLVTQTDRGLQIKKETLNTLHPYIQGELLYRMLCDCSGRKKDIERIHVDLLKQLIRGQSGKSIQLIYQMEAYVDQYSLYIQKPLDKKDLFQKDLPEFSMKTRVFPYKKDMKIPTGNYTKWFDYDKIETLPIMRFRQSGDYFFCTPSAKKKLQDYMVDAKISLTERDSIPLIAKENHIIWIVGYRISEFFKVTDTTKMILEITLEKKGEPQ